MARRLLRRRFEILAQLRETSRVSPAAMNTDEKDDLWELLGKSRQPVVSPYFSRNVLREVRNLPQRRSSGFLTWLRQHWQVPALATCMIVLAGGAFVEKKREEQQQLTTIAQTVYESPDYQVIAHLDELLASEETSVWLDSNVY